MTGNYLTLERNNLLHRRLETVSTIGSRMNANGSRSVIHLTSAGLTSLVDDSNLLLDDSHVVEAKGKRA